MRGKVVREPPVKFVLLSKQPLDKVDRVLVALGVLHKLPASLAQMVSHDGADEVMAALNAPEQRVHARQILVLVLLQQRHQARILHLHQRPHLHRTLF